MQTNDTTVLVKQIGDTAMHMIKQVAYHLLAGIVIGAILGIGVKIGLQRMGVSRRVAGQFASAVMTLTVVAALVVYLLKSAGLR